MVTQPTRLHLSIRKGYEPVIEEIKEHRPQLNSQSIVIERALDFYLDSIKKTKE